MKDVISVDSPVIALLHKCDHEPDEITKYVVIDQSEFVPQLHSLLISKLPEKRPTIEQFRGTDLKYDAGAFDGYNKCLDDMHRVIDEMFNTKEKIQ